MISFGFAFEITVETKSEVIKGEIDAVDCKIFMQGEPGTFFILNDGDLLSTKMLN